jgi:NADH dehydrogenase
VNPGGSTSLHVVVIGAGFAGLTAARMLAKAGVRVTLVDRRNHHVFQPLLYQVATAGLSATDIAAPILHLLHGRPHATVLLGEVTAVDVAARRITMDGREIAYDFLIVAAGATHSYFGHDEWARHAPGLKSLEDALEIRRRILLAFERAECEEDPETQRAWLTFTIIGAGPTGVEMAGTLAEIARHTLVGDFRRIDPRSARVLLLEGAERVLPPFAPDLSARAQRELERLGVQVRTGALVTAVDAMGVSVGDERIATRTVIWAAGVAASPLGAALGAPLDRAGRVVVEPDLSLPGHPEVLVAGDLAAVTSAGKPVPGVAAAALQMGAHAARAILADAQGRPRTPFRYRDKGSLATVGRKAAVAERGSLHVSGLLAWLAWLFIHIFFLIGFRNRVVVLFEWAVAYLTYERSARIILDNGTLSPVRAPSHPISSN